MLRTVQKALPCNGEALCKGLIMSGKTRKSIAIFRNSTLFVAILGLAACDDAGNFSFPSFGNSDGSSDTGALASSPQVTMVERDVEAPDVFGVTENGLWDGRPSLGGVWVAHPDVTDPERVIIRNENNGQFVIGALFRRERENPGPALQVSSDAAETLGMLAGAPSRLNVVALRREEVAEDVTAELTGTLEAPAPVAETPLEPIASAPLDEVVATPTPAPAPLPPVDDTVASAAAAIAAVEAAASAGVAAPAATTVVPTPAPAPSPAPEPVASGLAKPFIQIGIFSIEGNATRTAELMRGNGLSTKVIAQQSSGRAFWRVVVGPAPTAQDRSAVLSKVKSLGFTDAYAVSN